MMKRVSLLFFFGFFCFTSPEILGGTPGKVTDLRLIPTPDPTVVNLKWTTPGGLGACGDGLSQQTPAPSCYALKLAGSVDTDGTYWIDPNGGGTDDAFQTYCDMTSDGGGWTLVLKVDGTKTTFGYDSAEWTNANPYNPTQPNLDATEAKLASFSTLAFDEVRLNIKTAGITKSLRFSQSADSLLSMFTTGVYQPLSLGRTAWKNLIRGSSLQSYCNKEGFNVQATGARVRLGILGNQETDCSSSESRLGIGGAGNGCSQDNTNTCGNTATCSPDNGNQNIKSFAYVFVRESQPNLSACSPPSDSAWEIRLANTPPGIATGTVTVDTAAQFSRGGGPFTDTTTQSGAVTVQVRAPARPSVANRIAKFTAPSLAGAGVTVTDGTYLYARRWGTYPGPTNFVKVGTGHNGTIAGQNLGAVGPSLPDSLSAAFHQGFIYYPISGNAFILRRIDPTSGVTVDIPVPDGLLTRESGEITGGASLITSNGVFLFSLSYGINNGSNNGWRIRTYFLSGESFLLVDDLTIPTSSYYTDGVMADGAMIFPYEWTSSTNARIRRIRLSDGVTEEEWILPQAANSEYPINGQYDPVHNEFWLGDLYSGTFYRFPGANLYPQATYFSEVFDRGAICDVDNVTWNATDENGATVSVLIRTSNDGQSWTDWVGPLENPEGTTPTVDPGRYVQLRADLPTYGGAAPTLHTLSFSTTGEGYTTATPVTNDLVMTLPGTTNEWTVSGLQNDGDYHVVVRPILTTEPITEYPPSNVVTRPGDPWSSEWVTPPENGEIHHGDVVRLTAVGGCGFESATLSLDGQTLGTTDTTDEYGSNAQFDPRDYLWKRPIYIAAGATLIDDSYSTTLPYNTNDPTFSGWVADDGRDVRLGYGTSDTVELNRILVPERNEIIVRVPGVITPGNVNGQTSLYFGHIIDGSSTGPLGTAPADPRHVYFFFDDFDDLSLQKWSTVDGPWSIQQVGGRWAVQRDPTAETLPANVDTWRLMAQAGVLTDFEMSTLIRYPSGYTYAHPGVYFRSSSSVNYDTTYYRQAPNELQGGWINNDVFNFANKAGVTAPANTWFHHRVVVSGLTFGAWLNGQPVMTGQSTHFTSGTVGLWNTASYALTEAPPAFDDVSIRKLLPSDAGQWMGPLIPQSAKEWGAKRSFRFSLSLDNVAPGEHQLTAVVTDRCGRTVTLSRTVSVITPVTDAPVISSPTDGEALAISTVDVMGTAPHGSSVVLRVDGVETATTVTTPTLTTVVEATSGANVVNDLVLDGDSVRLADMPTEFPTNVALGKSTVATHTYSTQYASWKAVDGKSDPGNIQDYYWLAPDNVKNATVTVDLGQLYAVGKIRCLNTKNGPYNDRGTKDYKIGVSADGSLFTIIKTGAMTQNDITTWYTTELAQPAVARYVRFYADTHWGAGSGLAEIEVFGSSTGIVGTMESPWLPVENAWFMSASSVQNTADGTINLEYAFTPGQWSPLDTLGGKNSSTDAIKLRATLYRTVAAGDPSLQSITLHWMGTAGGVVAGDSAGIATFRFSDVLLADGEHTLDVLSTYPANAPAVTSAPISVVVDTTPPETVTDLTALPGTAQGDIRLTWSAPADLGPTGNVESYQLRRALSTITPIQWKYATVVTTAVPKAAGEIEVVVDSGLDPTKTYYYGLISTDAFGHPSELSVIASSVPKDTTAPSVSITAPGNTATVSGAITVSANASDNVGVTKVEFSVDSTALGTDTSSPYSVSLDTKTLEDGNHAIKAVGFDAFGNNTLAAITVTVDNTKPTITIAPPATPTWGSVLLSYITGDNLTPGPSLKVTNEAQDPPPFLYWAEGAKTATLTVKDNGNNTENAAVNFVIDRTGPAPISNLAVIEGPEGTPVDLSWTAPADTLSTVATYQVNQWVGTTPVSGTATMGDLLVATSVTVDDVRSRIMGTVTAGDDSVVVENGTGFNIGDEVLLYVALGEQAGRWETGFISEVSANTLTFEGQLLHGYSPQSHTAVVQRIPHYGNVVVLAGGVLTAHPWDGATGGIVAFRARTLSIDPLGAISADGLGYRGYPGTTTPYQCKKLTAGLAGEGFGGWNQSTAPLANGNGGGGGANNCGDLNKAGGGGGGHATAGGISSASGCQKPGVGGVPASEPTLAKTYFGGGGGQGGADEDGGSPGFGGQGGGVLLAWTDTLTLGGTISARGQTGGNACNGCGGCGGGGCGMGGGGGGAGGSVWLTAKEIVFLGGTITVGGGNGGAHNGCGTAGGAGSAGRVRIDTSTPGFTLAGAYVGTTPTVAVRGWTPISTNVPSPAAPGTSVGMTINDPLPAGSAGFMVQSLDVVGNPSGLSNLVYVDNTPPEVTIVYPTSGALIHRPIQVLVETSDNVAVETVQFWVDGELVEESLGAQFVAFDWDVTLEDDGEHTLTVVAVDTEGLEGTVSIPVTLAKQEPLAPTISLPLDGTVTSDTTHVLSGTAEGWTTVTAFANGEMVGESSVTRAKYRTVQTEDPMMTRVGVEVSPDGQGVQLAAKPPTATNWAAASVGAIVSGNSTPQYTNDGSTSTCCYWSANSYCSEQLTLMGHIELKDTKLINKIKFLLWNGDGRSYYNYKVLTSVDADNWDVWVDTTGSGANYQAWQEIDRPTRPVRYFQVWLSGNTINCGAHIIEFQAFDGDDPVAGYVETPLLSQTDAQYVGHFAANGDTTGGELRHEFYGKRLYADYNLSLANSKPAIQLDGANDYVNLPTAPFVGKTALTVEGWMRFDSMGQSWSRFVDIGQINKTFLVSHVGTSATVTFRLDSLSGAKIIEPGVTWTVGKWTHVAAQCGPSGMKLFLDGKLVGSNAHTGCINELPGVPAAYIGRSHWGQDGYTFGSTRDVRISPIERYTTDFTPPEFHEVDANTLALWRLTDGMGTQAKDASGQENHGTYVNDVLWNVSGKTGAWSTPYAKYTDGETLQLTGITSWGPRYITSNQPLLREQGLEAYFVVKTPPSNQTQYMMVGWRDNGSGTSYTDMVYAFYFSNGANAIYEDGAHRGNFGNYNYNTWYEVRVVLKPTTGASYYLRPLGTAAWTLIYDTTYSTEAPLRVFTTNYSGDFQITKMEAVKWGYRPIRELAFTDVDPSYLRFRTWLLRDDSETPSPLVDSLTYAWTDGDDSAATGLWRVLGVPLGEGSHTLTATASDGLGESIPSAPVILTVDNGPPLPIIDLVATSQPNGNIDLQWSAPTDQPVTQYALYRSSTPTINPAVMSPFTTSSTVGFVDLPATDGLWYYGVTSADSVGNYSAISNIVSAQSDRVKPTMTVVFTNGPLLGLGTHTLTATVSESLAAPPTLWWTSSSGGGNQPVELTQHPTNPLLYLGSVEVLPTTPGGTGTFNWSGEDTVGNTAGVIGTGKTFTVDTVPPTVVITLSPTSPVKAGEVTVTLTASENLGAIPQCSWTPQGGVPVVVTLTGAAKVYTGTTTIDPTTPNGTATFGVTMVDLVGNAGTIITQGATFVVDTAAPPPPESVTAVVGNQGVVTVSWIPGIGETAASYRLYRSAEPILSIDGLTPVATGLITTTKQDTPPGTGVWYYAVTAVDLAKNESAPTSAPPVDVDLTPPGAPVGLTALLTDQNTKVALSWSAPGGEAVQSYQIYRAVDAFSGSVLGKTPLATVLGTTAYVDVPLVDNIYYYVVTAKDTSGNQSGLSNQVVVAFDHLAPIITISGTTPGQFHKTGVTPEITINDLTLQSSSIKLNGAPYVSGTTILADGQYTLTVTATDALGLSSSKVVSFTIDKVPPVIQLAGFTNGQTYVNPVTPTVTVVEPYPTTQSIKLNGVNFTSGTTVTQDGVYTLVVTAQDAAGNSATATGLFTIAIAPDPVAWVHAVVDTTTGVVTLSWAPSEEPDAVLYQVVRDGEVWAETTQWQSAAGTIPDVGQTVEFGVRVVDNASNIGDPRLVAVEFIDSALQSAGLLIPGVGYRLTRGCVDQVEWTVDPVGSSPLPIVGLVLSLVGAGEQSLWTADIPQSGVLGAQDPTTLSNPVFVPTNTPSTVDMTFALMVAPQQGATAEWRWSSSVNVRQPLEPVVGVNIPDGVKKGLQNLATLTIHNQCSAPIGVKTATAMGGAGVNISLLTMDGVMVAQGNVVDQTPPLFAGNHVIFVNPAATWESEPVGLGIPVTATAALLAQLSNVVIFGGPQAAPDWEVTSAPIHNGLCPGGYTTIHGSPFADTMIGTAGNDCLFGYEGDDVLIGLGGDDLLLGGPGNDNLTGDLGQDVLVGGDGNDWCSGGTGNDTVFGGLGDDTLLGGGNWDLLDGGPGVDTVSGDAGQDVVLTSSGPDGVNGGSGTDICTGVGCETALAPDTSMCCSVGPGLSVQHGGTSPTQCALHWGTLQSDTLCQPICCHIYPTTRTVMSTGSCATNGGVVKGTAAACQVNCVVAGGLPVIDGCNGTDDDCNGKADEWFTTVGNSCDGNDADQCALGTVGCMADGTATMCQETGPTQIEVCNDVDDDCDGLTDEGFNIGAACDGADTNLCPNGVTVCDSATAMALEFDGNNDYGRIFGLNLSTATKATVEAWVRFDSFAQYYSRIVDFGAQEKAFLLGHKLTTNTLAYHLYTPSGTKIVEAPNVLVAGKWHHVAASCGPLGMNLFLDGKLVGSNPFTGCFDQLQSHDNYFIGRSNWAVDGYLKGAIGAIRISGSQLYTNDFAPPMLETGPGVLALYRMDEGTGSMAFDSGPAQKHARLYGPTWAKVTTAEVVACYEPMSIGQPTADGCGNGDEDCDGVTNEDCVCGPATCAPATTVPCGADVTDACGVSCGIKGTACDPGKVCHQSQCLIPGTPELPGASCADILQKAPQTNSGLKWIDPNPEDAEPARQVWCDMETESGGWTVFFVDENQTSWATLGAALFDDFDTSVEIPTPGSGTTAGFDPTKAGIVFEELAVVYTNITPESQLCLEGQTYITEATALPGDKELVETTTGQTIVWDDQSDPTEVTWCTDDAGEGDGIGVDNQFCAPYNWPEAWTTGSGTQETLCGPNSNPNNPIQIKLMVR